MCIYVSIRQSLKPQAPQVAQAQEEAKKRGAENLALKERLIEEGEAAQTKLLALREEVHPTPYTWHPGLDCLMCGLDCLNCTMFARP